ncbi:MAG: DUF2752 domain-containing protein [Ruminococcus sp.]|nr:DUF2752 domain-containing protein [Ruminococcus sp.]
MAEKSGTGSGRSSLFIVKLVVLAAAPLAVVLGVLFRDEIVGFVKDSGPCLFHLATGYYCPGCGNTRSAEALLHGNVLLALRNNAVLPFLMFVLLILYIELIFSVLGKPRKILPRKAWFWWAIGGIWAVYLVLRNFVPFLSPV